MLEVGLGARLRHIYHIRLDLGSDRRHGDDPELKSPLRKEAEQTVTAPFGIGLVLDTFTPSGCANYFAR